ncbi:MAG: hypothetical protein IJP99_08490 [Methanobrevibacter sp.]|nr:hypothetical protein [Methanobrevibacter sp.]
MIDYNECYYSPGTDKHSCCTHPHYCIFNPKRIQLEKSIHSLEQELHYRNKSLEFTKKEGTPNTLDYRTNKSRIKILNNELKNLREFRKKIIKMEVKEYGFIQL